MLKQEEIERFVESTPCVKRWLNRLEPTTRYNYTRFFYSFYQWLQQNGDEYIGLSPKQLLDAQDKTLGRERFRQLDLIQQWILNANGRLGTKQHMYSAVRSFYMHNRVPLPKDVTFKIKGDKPPILTELTVDELRKIILSSNDTYQAIYLCMFQASMGCNEFLHFNTQGWKTIKPQLEEGKQRLKVTFPGRKHAKNKLGYYSFIGKDGVNALKNYLENTRGHIATGEPIFLDKRGKPVSRAALERYFIRHAAELGLIKQWTPQCPKCGSDTRYTRPWKAHGKTQPVIYVCNQCRKETPASEIDIPKDIRYKLHPHEMRDLFRSEWDLSQAKSVCAEFFMGHDIDPNNYNKIMKLHPDWAERQYSLAEPYFNIMSEDPRRIGVDRLEELIEKRARQMVRKELPTLIREELAKMKEEI